MTLLDHYRQVFYAESLLVPYHAGVSVGLGITVDGFLGAFIYNNDNNHVTQCVWPRQLTADIPHMVGATFDGGVITLYVDGDHYARNQANTGWENVVAAEGFSIGPGNHASLGGVWFGYQHPLNMANAHRVHLGRFSTWDRALTRPDMWLIHAAAGEWRCYEVQRIGLVLDFAGWPAAWRAGLAVPHTTYQLLGPTKWDEGADAVGLIQRAADSVNGVVFVAADGKLTYQTPADRAGTAGPDITFTESDGTAIDDTFAYSIDDNDIVNRVQATTPDGAVLDWSDAGSLATYGERVASVDTDLLYPRDIATAANALLARYAQPILRCPTVTVDVAATPDAMHAVFDLELGAVIGLAELPGTAPATDMTLVVESVGWTIDADSKDWRVTFEVSPGVTGGGGGGSYSDEVLADSPLFYLRLDDTGATATDSSTNGHDGAYSGSTYTQGAAPLFGGSTGAVAFDHSGGVTVGDVTGAAGGDAFTVEVWVKVPAGQQSGNIVRQANDDATDFHFDLHLDSGEPSLTIMWADTSVSYLTGDPTLDDGAAHHLVVAVDGTLGEAGLKMYVDGEEVVVYFSGGAGTALASASATSPVVADTGAYFAAPVTISDVAYYTHALSAARVVAHYAAADA